MCLILKRWRRGCSRGGGDRLGGGAPLALAADGDLQAVRGRVMPARAYRPHGAPLQPESTG
jgi:hypothetical protein